MTDKSEITGKDVERALRKFNAINIGGPNAIESMRAALTAFLEGK